MAVRTSFTAGEVLAAADLTDTFGAKSNLASPTFTGTPAAPTATAGTNTTQLATTAFVLANRGKVLQVVRATDSTNRSTTSTSFVDGSISVTITPQRNTSTIILIWSVSAFRSSNEVMAMQITDNSNNAISGAEFTLFGGSSLLNPLDGNQTMIGYSTPATISATTYKGRFLSGNGATVTLKNGGASTGQLFAIEVAA